MNEGFAACTECVFAGLDFDGVEHTARVSTKRGWRIALAIKHILRCKSVSGKALEHLIGHFTWAALARREVFRI